MSLGSGQETEAADGQPSASVELGFLSRARLRIFEILSPLYLRLAVLVAVVLLPMVIYSVVATYDAYQESRSQSHESILRFGQLAASRGEFLVESTRRMLVALAETNVFAAGGAAGNDCTLGLSRLANMFPEYTSLAVTDADGRVLCSSDVRAQNISVADRTWFQQARASRNVQVSRLVLSKLNKVPVVVVAVPLGERNEPFRGVISVGIDVLWLAGLTETTSMPAGGVVFLFDRDGTSVTRSGRLVDVTSSAVDSAPSDEVAGLPGYQFVASVIDHGLRQFTTTGRDGVERIYSVTPLGSSDLFVVFGIPESSSFGWPRRDLIRGILTPLAMLLCALLGVAFGGDLLVARGLRALLGTARAFQRGDYSARPDIKRGSREVRQLADTLAAMADRVQQHEQELRQSVHQSQAMLKEIHHRVKNNLQVVTSLLSLQANRLRDEASKRALAELQRRVRALGLLHRHLYEGDDLRYLDFSQFTRELCQMVQDTSGPGAQQVRIEVDIPPIPLTADRAVPLGLLITEAVGNAFKHAFPDGRAGLIRISLIAGSDGTATVSIADDGIGTTQPASENSGESSSSQGTGLALMQAFAQQLGSTLKVDGPPGTIVSFSFDLADTKERAPA
jgi:two-component sensor histidine kinase